MCNTYSLQQWLSLRASILRYTYIACLVFIVRKLISNKFVYPTISNYLKLSRCFVEPTLCRPRV